jgi:pyridoxamine 5'-phosphate oxidase
MKFQDCIDFVLKNPNGFTATAEGDQPHVRPLTVWRADGTGIYFFLPKFKPVYRQLRENPKTEIAFHQPGTPQDLLTLPDLGTVTGIGTLLRVTGRFEYLEDADTRKQLFDIHPWLKQLGDGTDNPMIAIFRIAEGEFSFWTLENNFQSNPASKISFP